MKQASCTNDDEFNIVARSTNNVSIKVSMSVVSIKINISRIFLAENWLDFILYLLFLIYVAVE